MSQYDPLERQAAPPDEPMPHEDAAPEPDDLPERVGRGRGSDPTFGLILGFAVSIGLAPLVGAGDPSLRYTLSWGVLAAFGVLAWLLGGLEPFGEQPPDTLVWGVGFGLLIGVPLMLFGGGTLNGRYSALSRACRAGRCWRMSCSSCRLPRPCFFGGFCTARARFGWSG
jgi:hypothetical protein